MKIYDEQGNLMTEAPDLMLGWLRDDTRTVHHDAVEGVQEQGHYVVIAEYPNGGKDVEWVVDVPGVEAREAWDETIEYQTYIPYTEEELAEMNAPDEPDPMMERLEALEEQNAMLLECLLEMSELVYS